MAADYTYIYQNLLIGGGIFTSEGMKELAEEGITHIIDCQAEFDDTPIAAPFGIKVLWLPLFDDFTAPDFKEFDRVALFLKEHFNKDPKKFKILVHCAAGVHRGPMVGYLVCRLLTPAGEDPVQHAKTAVGNIEFLRQIASLANPYKNAVDGYIAKQDKDKSKRS
jgi:protein-tyrosine phosphatase